MKVSHPVYKILVIKHRHLGDVLLSGPVFSNLRAQFPKAQIDAYIWKEAYPMLAGHPGVDGFLLYDRAWKQLSFRKRLSKELSVLKEVRSRGYDLVLNLTEGDRGCVAARVSGAKTRVGLRPKSKWMEKGLNYLVKPTSTPRHTVEKDLDALRMLGIFPEERELFFHTEALSSDLLPKEPFVLIHPVSRWRFKCPPPKWFARLIDAIDEPVVLSGGPSEVEILEEMASLAKRPIVNLAGKMSLKQLGFVMQKARALITVDSVPLHIASALKVPTVALFGPTSEQNWGPWKNPHARVVAHELPCRPCFQDGCGGSKMADCLWSMPVPRVVDALKEVTTRQEVESLLPLGR